MTYVSVPIEADAEALIADVYAEMADRFPGWQPNEGSIEVWLIRALAVRHIVPLAELAADVPELIFARFGETVHNVPRIAPAAATVTSTWTLIDNAGYTIPAGTEVAIRSADGTLYGFRTLEDVFVLAGATATADGEVILEAVEPGADANGLSADPALIDALSFVEAITLEDDAGDPAVTAGGADGEDPATYLDRLAETLRTLAPRPILPRDVEVIARSVAGVTRAVALDGYDPGDDSTDNERMVTVAVHDPDGVSVGPTTLAAVEALLTALRETNFVFHAIDPTYTAVKVSTEIVAYPDFDPVVVKAATADVIEAFLSPGNWGRPPYGPAGDNPALWLDTPIVRYQDLSTLINNVTGVDHHTDLEFAKGADALGTADVTLPGPAALPTPGVIAVT